MLPLVLAILGMAGVAAAVAQGGEGRFGPKATDIRPEFGQASFELHVPESGPDVKGAWVIGPDERIQITDTTEAPWRSVVQLVAFDENSNILSTCSGSMVDDLTVLTAAHCVFDDANGIYHSILAIPGSDGINMPFGSGFAYGYSVSLPVGWVNSAGQPLTQRVEYDFALLHLQISDFSTATRPFMPLGSPTDAYLASPAVYLASAGYPGDKSLGTMWLATGYVQLYSENTIYSDMDVVPGQSGAPLWLVDFSSDSAATVGVISLHGTLSNVSVRFSPGHLAALHNWCAAEGCSISFVDTSAPPPSPTPTYVPTEAPTNTPTPTPTPTATVSPTVMPTSTPVGGGGGVEYERRLIAPALARN